MPELPEVETIKRGLSSLVLNKKIVQVKVLENKAFIGEITEVLNTKIVPLRRKGKALIFDLDNGYSFLVHLRMTGQLIYVGAERFAGGHPSDNFLANLPNRQTRVIFELKDAKLFFNDQRKFGFIKVLKTTEVENDSFIKKLGPEPWEMSAKDLGNKLKNKHTCIKAALLDQTIMAGLGNIYADETLFFAGVLPTRICQDLSSLEIKKIIQGARKTMEQSLEAGGSTLKNYVKADGSKGDYLELFAQVFNRAGAKCPRCGGEIEKTRVAGRGTYLCRGCQK